MPLGASSVHPAGWLSQGPVGMACTPGPPVGDTGPVARDDDIETISEPGPEHVPVRRRPDMVRFLVVGGLVGYALGSLLGWLGPDAPGSNLLQEMILLGSVGLLVGVLLAAVAYLVADRRSAR